MTRFNTLPPFDLFSKPVAALMAEIDRLHRRHEELRGERAALGGIGMRGDIELERAQHADIDLTTAAARAGEDANSIGQPTVDALLASRAEVNANAEAVDRAIDATSDELRQALRANSETISAGVSSAVSEAAQRYDAAVDTLTEARRRYLEARAVSEFVDRCTAPGRLSYASYVVPTANELPSTPSSFHAVVFAAAVDGMRAEARLAESHHQ